MNWNPRVRSQQFVIASSGDRAADPLEFQRRYLIGLRVQARLQQRVQTGSNVLSLKRGVRRHA